MRQKTRDFRLGSLQDADDFAFSASFEKESNQPLDFWEGRISNPFSKHFVAYRAPQNADLALRSSKEHPLLGADAEWVGIVVLLGPKLVATASFSNETSWKAFVEKGTNMSEADNPDTVAYHIVAFYTASTVRGQGLGKILIENALHYILESRDNEGIANALCTTGVEVRNGASQAVFRRLGFFDTAARDSYVTDDGRALEDVIMRWDMRS